MKLAFPSTTGKRANGRASLRYTDVIDEVLAMREAAQELGLPLVFESFPSCVLRDKRNRNVSRSGFGETHYLDDVTGDRVYPIDHIEAALSAYPESCQRCRAIRPAQVSVRATSDPRSKRVCAALSPARGRHR